MIYNYMFFLSISTLLPSLDISLDYSNAREVMSGNITGRITKFVKYGITVNHYSDLKLERKVFSK